jgi:hypothetical protein
MFLNYVSFWLLQVRGDMNEKAKHMEENIERVRKKKKTILHATVGLLSSKCYIGIKFRHTYIPCDN